jgi:nucleotide-binding universal stress UspA family protein
MEINKIIVPVDFGKTTIKLVEFALYIATQLTAEIGFCHVVEPFSMGDMMLGSPSLGDLEKQIRINAEERMANLIEDNDGKGLTCRGKVLFGDTVEEIIAYAREQRAGMIIIGTHGAKGLEKIMLGSVAERVVKRSDCPCLVMNPYK